MESMILVSFDWIKEKKITQMSAERDWNALDAMRTDYENKRMAGFIRLCPSVEAELLNRSLGLLFNDGLSTCLCACVCVNLTCLIMP